MNTTPLRGCTSSYTHCDDSPFQPDSLSTALPKENPMSNTAPKITPPKIIQEQVEASIGRTIVTHPEGTNVTLVTLITETGFAVTGESSCVSKENFYPALGIQFAKDRAIDKLWGYLGFQLSTQKYRTVNPTSDTIEKVAELCHETNRAICESVGDFTQVPWAETPDYVKVSAEKGVSAVFADPNLTPEGLHAKWMSDKVADGWVYGPVKDASAKTHPCICDYSQLAPADKLKDIAFLNTVRSAQFGTCNA